MEIKIRVFQCGFIAILITFSSLFAQNAAQVQQQECINQLRPCLIYLNGNNKPPDSCCRPLDYIIKSLPECLCSLMSNQGANLAEQAGINTTEAQALPGRCGQRINPLGCITGTPDTRSGNSVPNSASAIVVRTSILSSIVIAFSMYLILREL